LPAPARVTASAASCAVRVSRPPGSGWVERKTGSFEPPVSLTRFNIKYVAGIARGS
jgi:hypothetical protein